MFTVIEVIVFFVFAASVLLVGMFFWLVVCGFLRGVKKHRGGKLIAICEKLGPCIYYNKRGDILAACRVSDFRETTVGLSRGLKPWETLGPVRVKQTFTFCFEEFSRNKMHVVCSREEARVIKESLVEKITRCRKDFVDKESFEKAIKLLVQHNPQLFVPFAKRLSEKEGQKQLHFYGEPASLEEARKHLLNGCVDS